MNGNKTTLTAFLLLILISALYRAVPGHVWGFTPQIAMAVFGGSVIRDRKLSFALPLLSLFLSDLIYQLFYMNGIGSIPGFYEGQLTNYLLFTSLTVVGFWVNRKQVLSILAGAVTAPTLFFLASNFLVWVGGGGLKRPLTFSGLVQCYNDALPFYWNSLYGTLFFSGVFFGGYYLLKRFVVKPDQAAA
jgi:hypothetical protein